MPPGRVVSWTIEGRQFGTRHERATRDEVARRLAALRRCEFMGEYDAALHGPAPATYFVPSDTLHLDAAAALGIGGPANLFGGVVPHLFVATKVITHPLVRPDAERPAGWVVRLGEALGAATLDGFSAFCRADAQEAGERLLARHPALRLKPARAAGGKGQCVVAEAQALARWLDALDPGELRMHGVVLEENLRDPLVHSIGQVRVDDLLASYHGVQRETRSNHGHPIYGGTDLHMVRGGFDDLLSGPLPPGVRRAVEQASAYHAAVIDCYPGVFASRINYDVAQGTGRDGRACSGVLEQSWRIGGATGAEIAALEVLRERPGCRAVDASCVEAYGGAAPPPGATVYFHGDDPDVGPIAKYAFTHPDADPD